MDEDSDNTSNNKEWLTPKEVSEQYNVPLRTVYGWITRNLVESQGEKRSTRISRVSVVQLQQRQVARAFVEKTVVTPEGEKPQQREVKNTLAIEIAARENERQKLVQQIAELQETRRQDALQIGELREKARQLERAEAELNLLRGEYDQLQKSNTRFYLGFALSIFIVLVIVVVLVLLRR